MARAAAAKMKAMCLQTLCIFLLWMPGPFHGTFDAVLDKGLMDSVLANHDRIELWKKVRANRAPDPLHVQQGENSLETVQAVLGEISRILKPGGVYAAVSHEKPERRLPVIRASMSEHKVSHSAYDAEKEFYMYTAVK
eukprot:GHVU01014181.1.p2 GENE.GHVU01014181.1~~GHVU01014181.1.p2  ORF type:complete len:138 (+),score=17.10 GHVU01014181.1:335-748(+)